MAPGRSPNVKRLVFLIWILVALFYFYLSYGYVQVTMNDREFGEYLQKVVQLAGNDRRPPRDIRELVLIKADQLSLPVRGDQISVLGGANSLNIVVIYDVEVEIPLLRREIYTKRFEHNVKYQNPH